MNRARPRVFLRSAAVAAVLACGLALAAPALAGSAGAAAALATRSVPTKAVAATKTALTKKTAPGKKTVPGKKTAPGKKTPAPVKKPAPTVPTAPTAPSMPVPATGEGWAAASSLFHAVSEVTRLNLVDDPTATDGKALKLQLNARPEPGPSGGALIATDQLYRYGTFGSRLRTADCTGQDHVGVVTGTFTYSTDHSDADHNGVSDNDEIDIEFLCAQPNVVYLTLWTDYSETSNDLREITRVIDLSSGQVLSTCFIVSYGSGCQPLLAGENSPASVPATADFRSDRQYRSYWFDWQPDHVTFRASGAAGGSVVLWDYRGPRARIPSKPSAFMQNVTYTKAWDPLTGPSHNQPTADTSAYVDADFLPAVPAT